MELEENLQMTKAVPPSRTDPDVENVTKTVTTVN
jgi:hypothetical protein